MTQPNTNISTPPSVLSGEIRVPASKSLLHRGLFCAALAGDAALCALPPDDEISDDVGATFSCAEKLLRQTGADFDCRESGTTLRLLVPILAALGIPANVTGSGRLPRRPLAEYAEAFGAHGAHLGFPGEPGTFLPLRISGRLTPGAYGIRGDVSSQYISGLLTALPLLAGDSRIVLGTPLESEPYVRMTLAVLAHFGIRINAAPDGWQIPGGQRYRAAAPYVAEADWSQAAFWLLAAHIGNPVAVSGLCRETAQGDSVFPSLLGMPEADVSDCPDLLPALAGAACFRAGDTVFTNAARLRLKESDRLESTRAMLAAFGVGSEITRDSMTVRGAGPDLVLRPCTVDGANDHRIVMTAAILSTRASGPVEIRGADAVRKSYPQFWRDFASLSIRK